MVDGIIANFIADAVVEAVHKATFVNGQHLVECSRDVEAECISGIFHAAADFFTCEIAAVGCTKVEFVAVFPCLDGAEDGSEHHSVHLPRIGMGQGEVSYARELVIDLLLFHLQLLGVGEHLPLATAADAKMLAHRLLSCAAILSEADDLRLGIMVFLLADLEVNDIAWHTPRDEDNELRLCRAVVCGAGQACQSLALSGNVGDGYVLEYG